VTYWKIHAAGALYESTKVQDENLKVKLQKLPIKYVTMK